MLRTTLALIATVLIVGAAQAADDSTSENDAIEIQENKLPGANEPSPSMGAVPDSGGSTDYEAKQLEEEKND